MAVREEVPVVIPQLPQPHTGRERFLTAFDDGGGEHAQFGADQRFLQGGYAGRFPEEVHQPCAARAGRSQYPHQLALEGATTKGLGPAQDVFHGHRVAITSILSRKFGLISRWRCAGPGRRNASRTRRRECSGRRRSRNEPRSGTGARGRCRGPNLKPGTGFPRTIRFLRYQYPPPANKPRKPSVSFLGTVVRSKSTTPAVSPTTGGRA